MDSKKKKSDTNASSALISHFDRARHWCEGVTSLGYGSYQRVNVRDGGFPACSSHSWSFSIVCFYIVSQASPPTPLISVSSP